MRGIRGGLGWGRIDLILARFMRGLGVGWFTELDLIVWREVIDGFHSFNVY